MKPELQLAIHSLVEEAAVKANIHCNQNASK